MRKAFAILDLLNIVLILALLASLFVPVYRAERHKESYEVSVRDLKAIAIALEKNYLETGSYHQFATLSDITSSDSILITEGFLDKVPTTDQWSRDFKGMCDDSGYKLEGFGIPTRSQSLMRGYPDYSFSTGVKFKQKGKRN